VIAQRHVTADLPHDGPSGDWYFDVTKSGGYLIECVYVYRAKGGIDLCANWSVLTHFVRLAGPIARTESRERFAAAAKASGVRSSIITSAIRRIFFQPTYINIQARNGPRLAGGSTS
jgi:hypothetical protein